MNGILRQGVVRSVGDGLFADRERAALDEIFRNTLIEDARFNRQESVSSIAYAPKKEGNRETASKPLQITEVEGRGPIFASTKIS